MTVDEGAAENRGDGRNILVGMEIDGSSRELLDWALCKVAKPGDRVVALHVCRDSDDSNNSPLSLIKSLDDYLTEYEDFCNLKQVVLVGKVSRGNSIRRVLVKEAKLHSAMTVVVGVNKNNPFGGPVSVARYCAKKLPPTTALLAIDNGKVIFERGATKLPPGSEPKLNLASILHPSLGMEPKVIIPRCEVKPELGDSRLSNVGSLGDDAEGQEVGNDSCDPTHDVKVEIDSSSLTLLIRKLPEPTPGWPLLRRVILANPGVSRGNEARNMSVVQWVMNLPDRSLSLNQPEVGLDEKQNPSGQDGASASTELAKQLETALKNSLSCRWFSHTELQNSTDQFSSENLIGKGASSRVYRGCLPDGQQVAVKKSKLSEESSRDFLQEIDIITTLQHEHVVPLMGVGVDDESLISVYSFFSRGSLEENLHGKRAKPPLSWDIRFKVALKIAEALTYLHNVCSRPVIHRDVKSSNILLSDEFEPQLSDFGLALWAPTDSSRLTNTDVVGTFGYLAPEYFMYGKVTDKIDVYSFGVVLLELLTGRKPINTEYSKGQESLVMWATLVLGRGDAVDLLDPNLEEKYNDEQVRRVILAASLCIRRTARLRPSMSQILNLLKGEEEEEDMESWINSHVSSTTGEELDSQDEETYRPSSVASHLGLALLDVDDDESISSFEQNYHNSLEDYIRGRWSRSSSFD